MYNASQAARKAGVSRQLVHTMTKRGLIGTPLSGGRGHIYDETDIEILVERKRAWEQEVTWHRLKAGDRA